MTDWLRRIAGVLKHLWLTAGGLLCRQGPLSASRWKFGVWIGPPKVLLAPKPTSSVRINRTLVVIILIIALFGGFSGRFRGYGYGYGHGGIGVLGVILIIVVVPLLTGRL
jgi:hypothetical protein